MLVSNAWHFSVKPSKRFSKTWRLLTVWCAWSATLAYCQSAPAPASHIPATYYVDCQADSSAGDGFSLQSPVHGVDQANSILLQPGDRLLFKRGSLCKGALRLQGSGSAIAPIRVGAYGEGILPRIEAGPADEAAFQLFNQQYWEVSSLDLAGGKSYGVYAGADTGVHHHLHFRDLRVHDVNGALKRKESGLVVVYPSSKNASFDDVELDGIQAWNTTQWSGIFVSGSSHVRISNSLVHDMQGDGIVVFESRDAVIARSIAWHTGMQHSESIGTPNAIWTWRCTDCTVEDNEAFLTDSPGVDGGAFDIDYGNTRNTVKRNFGHDTAGYCVSVFGAFGPTTESVVSDNLCIHNGMSPRLAQRQGALLMMTWSGGTLDGVKIVDNLVDWQPPGDTPAIQIGDKLLANGVTLRNNEIRSTGLSFVDPGLKYSGAADRYIVQGGTVTDMATARQRFHLLREKDSTITMAPELAPHPRVFGSAEIVGTWQLKVIIPIGVQRGADDDRMRGMLVVLKSAALQFAHAGLKTILAGDPATEDIARDWSLLENGVTFDMMPPEKNSQFSVKLISPSGEVVHEWVEYPSPVELGLELRQRLGLPDFGYLKFESVRATD
jgi:hypothetical protein